jgi:hypothetical protein
VSSFPKLQINFLSFSFIVLHFPSTAGYLNKMLLLAPGRVLSFPIYHLAAISLVINSCEQWPRPRLKLFRTEVSVNKTFITCSVTLIARLARLAAQSDGF